MNTANIVSKTLPPLTASDRKALRLLQINPARRITGGWLTRGQRISKQTASKLTFYKLAFRNNFTPAFELRITRLGKDLIN